MSDLQCPARLFVLVTGDAGSESPWVGTDDALTPAGLARSREVASTLAHQAISRVWTGPLPWTVQAAETASALLGVEVHVRAGLAGGVDGESERQVLSRYFSVLEEIADLHRGESVLVICHAGVVSRAHGGSVAWWDVVPLAGDADGWVVRPGDSI